MNTTIQGSASPSLADQKVMELFNNEDEPIVLNAPFKSHVPPQSKGLLHRAHRFYVDMCR